MATRTENLTKTITGIIQREFMLISPQDMSKLILKACKKAGLKFTEVGVKGNLEGACICKVEEIDVKEEKSNE